jgi:hypothetical protein
MCGELARRIQQTPQHQPEDHRGGIIGGGFPLRGRFDRFRMPEFLPQGSKDRDGAKRQRRGGHQFLGLAQQLLLLHVPGKGIGKFFEGAGSDQFVEAPEVGDDLLADAPFLPVRLDDLEIHPLRSVFAGEGEASQNHLNNAMSKVIYSNRNTTFWVFLNHATGMLPKNNGFDQ